MPDDLESELRALRPTGPSAETDARIAASIANIGYQSRSPRSDRMLRAALSAAIAASVLIVTLLATDGAPSAAAPPGPPADTARAITIADTPRLLAQLSSNSSHNEAYP